jgi:signal peptidase I
MEKEAVVKKKGIIREYLEAFFVAVLLALVIRSFIVEPYKIPSKSMVPTLLVGDHIFVNKFVYGLRLPGTKSWIWERPGPKRGEVIVFIYPEDESLDFIKRVVGLPGDHIQLKDGVVYVNGQKTSSMDLPVEGVDRENKRILNVSESTGASYQFRKIPFYRGYEHYQIKAEDLMGREHLMQRSLLIPNNDEVDLVVPEGHYFVLGDNRDQSADSRVWGFVPRENLKGEAMFIWLSLDSDLGGVRLGRFGKKII